MGISPKDAGTEKYGKREPFTHSVYHRHIEGEKPVIFGHLDGPIIVSGYLNL